MAYIDRILSLLGATGAHWRLDETSGTVMEDAGPNHRDGVYNPGGVALGARSVLSAELTNASIDIVGSGRAASVPYAAWMDSPQAYSVVALFAPDTNAGSHTVVARYGAGSSIMDFTLRCDDTSIVFWRSVGGSFVSVRRAGAVIPGFKVHVVATYDGANARLYINGVEAASGAQAVGNASANPLTIGTDATGGERFDGRIDEVSYLPGAVLTAQQVADLYADTRPAVAPESTGHYAYGPFDGADWQVNASSTSTVITPDALSFAPGGVANVSASAITHRTVSAQGLIRATFQQNGGGETTHVGMVAADVDKDELLPGSGLETHPKFSGAVFDSWFAQIRVVINGVSMASVAMSAVGFDASGGTVDIRLATSGNNLTVTIFRDGVQLLTGTAASTLALASVAAGGRTGGGGGLQRLIRPVTYKPLILTGTTPPPAARVQPLTDGVYLTFPLTPEITSYEARVDGGAPVAGNATRVLLSGLTTGQTYAVQWRAIEASTGTQSQWSASVNATPTADALLFDDFERDDSATGVGSPLQGSAYASSSAGAWGILAGAAYRASGGLAHLTASVGTHQHAVETVVTMWRDNAGLAFRYKDANNFWLVQYGANPNRLVLWRIQAGSSLLLASAPFDVRAGQRLGAYARDAHVVIQLDGRTVLNAEDHWVDVAGTRVGFYASDQVMRYGELLAVTASAGSDRPAALAPHAMPAALPVATSTATGHVYKGRDRKIEDTGSAV